MESETAFVAPEGVYTMLEEQKPPQIHTTMSNSPSTYPTRVSSIVVRFPMSKPGSSQGLSALLGGNKDRDRKEKERGKGRGEEKEREKEREKRGPYEESVSSSEPEDPGADATKDHGAAGPPSESDAALMSPVPPTPPILPTSLFSPSGAATTNRKKSVRRPKHNIRTTSSSFVTRLQSAEGLNKILAAKQGDVTFLFYNAMKSFYWTEIGLKAKDPLARITFSSHPTCHDVNQATSNHLSMDIVIGFSTGDLIWFDPLSSRYVRINKQGSINSSACTAVRWVPSSKSLFFVSHADGTIIVYDKERDDGPFVPKDPPGPRTAVSPSTPNANGHKGIEEVLLPPSVIDPPEQDEWSPVDEIFVTPGPSAAQAGGIGALMGGGAREKVVKNPISHWRVSKRAIVDFAFSPDVRSVAIVSDDGCLRVIDAVNERLVDTYASYFGSLSCVAWSPDGRFILTGGQDDLLTIFSPAEQRVIARCQGHSSFVSGVAFDDSKCDGRTYRFGSVGEDNKLILWDFSSGALHRPKAQAIHHRHSLSSTISLALRGRKSDVAGDRSTLQLPSSAISPTTIVNGAAQRSYRYHPAPSRNEVAVLQPVLVKSIEGDLLAGIQFLPSSLLVASRVGSLKLWVRPLPIRPKEAQALHKEKERIREHLATAA